MRRSRTAPGDKYTLGASFFDALGQVWYPGERRGYAERRSASDSVQGESPLFGRSWSMKASIYQGTWNLWIC